MKISFPSNDYQHYLKLIFLEHQQFSQKIEENQTLLILEGKITSKNKQQAKMTLENGGAMSSTNIYIFVPNE